MPLTRPLRRRRRFGGGHGHRHPCGRLELVRERFGGHVPELVEEGVERLAVAEEDVPVLVLRLHPRVLLELQRRQHLRGAEKKPSVLSARSCKTGVLETDGHVIELADLAAIAAGGGGGAGAGVAAVGDESLKQGLRAVAERLKTSARRAESAAGERAAGGGCLTRTEPGRGVLTCFFAKR